MPAPDELRALQQAFMRGLSEQPERPPVPVVAGHLPAELRWHIYANAYQSRLLESLREEFEQTWAYVGDALFDQCCLDYLAQHPPCSWTLRDLGAGFPHHLARTLAGHPEVAELAGFEWQLRAAFDAADAPVLTLAEIQRQPADTWPALRFVTVPSASLHPQHFNTLALWQALKAGETPPPPHYQAEASLCLIWRDGERLSRYRSLAPEEAAAVQDLFRQETFATLCQGLSTRLGEEVAAFRAGCFLQFWLAEGLIGGFRLDAPDRP